jgi:hypothetical protein
MYKLTIYFTIIFLLTSSGLDAQNNKVADSSGNKAIVEKVEIEASFPGGVQEWRTFLEKNLDANIPVSNGAPEGTYTVVVQFIVDKAGHVSGIKALTSHGYGMEKEVIRVISNGPDWVPAQQDGKPVMAYRKQPVTFVIIVGKGKFKKNRQNKTEN